MRPSFDVAAPDHLPALDGLRGLSVIVVVAFHCGVIDGGWIGVDLFFAISGFLITGLLVAEFERSGRIGLTAFWARRARRLLPGIVLVLALVALLAGVNQIDLTRRSVIGAITYSSNWLNIVGGHSYWDAFATPDPLRHLWSLAIEEQIYLLWPIIVAWALRSHGPRRLRTVAVVAAGLSALIQIGGLSAHWSIDRIYQGTDARAVPFLLGAAMATRGWPPRPHASRAVMTGASSVLLVAAIALPGDERWVFAGPLILVSVAGAALVTTSAGSTARFVTSGPLRSLGRWSYGIYLFHWPLVICSAGASLATWQRFPLVLALATTLAAITFTTIESPIRQRRWPPQLLVTSAVLACGVLVVAITLGRSSSPELDTSVTLPIAPSAATHRVMIFGDSVPALAADEIAEVAAHRHIDVEVRAEPGCSPSEHIDDQYGKPECVDFLLGTRERAARVDIDTAVLWWGGTMENFYENGTNYFFCDASARSMAATRIQRLLDYFAAVPTRLVILPIPRLDIPERHAAGTECEREIYRDVARANAVPVLDLSDWVCPSFPADCARINRYDGLHFDDSAATAVASIVFDRLSEVWAGDGGA